jgi:hypothetical protein
VTCEHAQHESCVERAGGEPVVVEAVRASTQVHNPERGVAEGRVERTSGKYVIIDTVIPSDEAEKSAAGCAAMMAARTNIGIILREFWCTSALYSSCRDRGKRMSLFVLDKIALSLYSIVNQLFN